MESAEHSQLLLIADPPRSPFSYRDEQPRSQAVVRPLEGVEITGGLSKPSTAEIRPNVTSGRGARMMTTLSIAPTRECLDAHALEVTSSGTLHPLPQRILSLLCSALSGELPGEHTAERRIVTSELLYP